MTHRWTTRQDGVVEVDGAVPEIDPWNIAAFKRQVMRWLPSATRHGDAHKVPVPWILGVIWAESNGIPTVVSPDHGYGLMQLTSTALFKGHPKENTLADPDLNIALGVEFMGALRRRVGFDLPKIASGYNAGLDGSQPHASATSPWKMRETPGHISRVVAASNTAVRLLSVPMTDDIRQAIVRLARGEVGDVTQEKLDRYWRTVGVQPTPDPHHRTGQWCGAFALWAIKTALQDAGVPCPYNWRIGEGFLFRLPRTSHPKPGDVCYLDAPFQHHSIVESLADGVLTTIDGNQPDIRRKMRKLPSGLAFYSIAPWLPSDERADTEPAPPPHPTLKRGSYGRDVRTIQGWVGTGIDGDFGPMTEAAVKDWQRAHGLVVDGIVGPKTWAALEAADAG